MTIISSCVLIAKQDYPWRWLPDANKLLTGPRPQLPPRNARHGRQLQKQKGGENDAVEPTCSLESVQNCN